jgi:hypothetical protein
VRNPYAVCRWAVERKPTFFAPSVPIADRLRIMAEHWHNSYRLALTDAERVPNVVFVRFEDFHADPAAVVRSLCELVGLGFDEQMVPQPDQPRPFATLPADRKWYPLYPDTWLDRCDEATFATVDPRCGELLARFGYSRAGAAPLPSASEIRRRRHEDTVVTA